MFADLNGPESVAVLIAAIVGVVIIMCLLGLIVLADREVSDVKFPEGTTFDDVYDTGWAGGIDECIIFLQRYTPTSGSVIDALLLMRDGETMEDAFNETFGRRGPNLSHGIVDEIYRTRDQAFSGAKMVKDDPQA